MYMSSPSPQTPFPTSHAYQGPNNPEHEHKHIPEAHHQPPDTLLHPLDREIIRTEALANLGCRGRGTAAPPTADIQHSRRRNEQREDCDKRLHNGSLECLAVAALNE